MTSAPRSASTWLAQGPAMMRLRSSPRTCDSGPAISTLPRLGRTHRRPRGERRVPTGDARAIAAPIEIGEAEIGIGQAAPDGDMTDAEWRCRQCVSIGFKAVKRRINLGAVGVEIEVRRMRSLALVAPEDQQLQQPIAQCVSPQRRPLRCRLDRKELWIAMERIKEFADHR